jgi:hypothetical protein
MNKSASQKNVKAEGITKPLLLIGTRNGDIMEAAVSQTVTTKINLSVKEKKVGIPHTMSLNELSDIDHSIDSSDQEEAPTLTQIEKKKPAENEMSLSFSLYMRNHSGTIPTHINNYKKRIFYTLHPLYNLMFTVGEDQNLCLWDIEKCELVTMKNLGVMLPALKLSQEGDLMPTAVKLSPDGDLIIIGFISGIIIALDSKMNANPFGKVSESK